MAEGRYSTLLEKMKKGFIGTGSGMDKLKAGWQWENGQYVKIWSGASTISYYDGATLIGTEEVDEGEDVLHPSLDTSKEGYTLYGWKLSEEATTREESLVATGDPMTLYAYYVPNTYIAASGSVTGSMGYTDYQEISKDTKYVTGTIGVTADRWYSEGDAEASGSFNLALNEYQQAAIEYWYYTGLGTDQIGKFDGQTVTQTQNTKSVSDDGTHTLYAKGHCVARDSWMNVTIGVVAITLSNPIAWE